MKIIRSNPNESGAYPPMQTWTGQAPPGYAIVPDTVDTTPFYEYNGFVVFTLSNGEVISMEGNVEAWEAWKAEQPEPTEPEPTTEEQMRADIDYIAAMTGVELT